MTDVFMDGHEPPSRRTGDFYRSKRGTPYVSDPTGRLIKPKRKADPPKIASLPYRRPSGFGKQIEDMYSIWKWAERQMALGFAIDPDLADAAKVLIVDDHDTKEWRSDADEIVVAAKATAKAGISADRGSHTHLLVEDDDEGRDIIARIEHGEDLGMAEDVQRSLVDAWRAMLERDGLEILATEAAVVHDGYRCAGTLDRIARLHKPLRFTLYGGEIVVLPAGRVLILDVKTGKRRLRSNGTVMYWQSYAVQVAVYAGATPYDTETDTRGTWPFKVDQRYAVIAHLDVLGALDGNPSCELVLVDIEAGRRAADLCVLAKDWETETTTFSVAQLDVPVEETVATAAASPASSAATGSSTGATHAPTPAPSGPVTAEGVACLASGAEPAPSVTLAVNDLLPRDGMPQHALDELEVDRLNEARRRSYDDYAVNPNPQRLALVEAREGLRSSPDEGHDWSTDDLTPVWDELKTLFDGLDPAARSWRSELVGQAQRRHVAFHAQGGRTERRYYINKAVIALALAGDSDDILRELLSHIIGDVALMLGVEPGHALGSLSVAEARRFAAHVDAYLSPVLLA